MLLVMWFCMSGRLVQGNTELSTWGTLLPDVPEQGGVFSNCLSQSESGLLALVGSWKAGTGGAAYIFSRPSVQSDTWSQVAKLVASDLEAGAGFASSCSLSPDGRLALIGAESKDEASGALANAGAAYTFVANSSSPSGWSFQKKLQPDPLTAGAFFGISVATNGLCALVGATGDGTSGAAYLFVRSFSDSDDWSLQQRWSESSGTADSFGRSVAVDRSCRTALVTADSRTAALVSSAGSAMIYTRSTTTSSDWNMPLELNAGADAQEGARFGRSGSMDAAGLVAAVGAQDYDGPDSQAGAVFIFTRPTESGAWSRNALILAPVGEREVNAHLGKAAALAPDGLSLLAGAYGKGSGGAAYLFRRPPLSNDWRATALLSAGNGTSVQSGQDFGNACAFAERTGSSEHSTALVGAFRTDSDSGAAFSFSFRPPSTRSSSPWQKMLPSKSENGARFGHKLAVSANGLWCVVAAPYENLFNGVVYIWSRAALDEDWQPQTSLNAVDDAGEGTSGVVFGNAVAISDSGTLIVGADYTDHGGMDKVGAAFVFVYNATWSFQAKLTPKSPLESLRFGGSVSLSSDGNVVCIGAARAQAGLLPYAFIFSRSVGSNNSWSEDQSWSLSAPQSSPPFFGNAVAISSTGLVALVAARGRDVEVSVEAGQAYVYVRESLSASWSDRLPLNEGLGVQAGAHFGSAVAMDAAADLLLVGAEQHDEQSVDDSGAAFLFARVSSSNWTLQSKLLPSDLQPSALFGSQVAIGSSGLLAVVSAPGADGFGAVYVFRRASVLSSEWTQSEKLTAANGADLEADARFGFSVGLASLPSQALVVAGADENDERRSNAGIAYSFSLLPAPVPTDSPTPAPTSATAAPTPSSTTLSASQSSISTNFANTNFATGSSSHAAPISSSSSAAVSSTPASSTAGQSTDLIVAVSVGVGGGLGGYLILLAVFCLVQRRRRQQLRARNSSPLPLVDVNGQSRSAGSQYDVLPGRASQDQYDLPPPRASAAGSAIYDVPVASGRASSRTTGVNSASSVQQRRAMSASDIEKSKKLGSGQYGEVWKATYQGLDVAVKEVKGVEKIAREQLLIEAERFQALTAHPNVVLFYGAIADPLSIVLEFCPGGSLDEALYGSNKRSFDEKEQLRIAREVCLGLAHLHRADIVHRDLAARNVLLGAGDVAKLTDFGMSREQTDHNQKTATTIGPIRWMAPEQMRSQAVSMQSDLWSFGVVLFEIFAQIRPWYNVGNVELCHTVMKGGHLPTPIGSPQTVAEVMSICFSVKPEERKSAVELAAILAKPPTYGSTSDILPPNRAGEQNEYHQPPKEKKKGKKVKGKEQGKHKDEEQAEEMKKRTDQGGSGKESQEEQMEEEGYSAPP